MTMELRHYAAEVLEFDQSKTYGQTNEQWRHFKPRGFWVSVLGEDDWPSWCRSEDFRTEKLAVEHEVRLTAEANVLLIENLLQFRDFDRRYAVPLVPGLASRWVDWLSVSEDYAGVIIAPYFWSQRLGDAPWYYSWDCASGCIWDLSAIESVRDLEAVAS